MGHPILFLTCNSLVTTQEKKLKNWYIQEQLEPRLNPNLKKKTVTKMNIDNGEYQQQSPQRLLDRYDHMNSRNKRQDLCLKPIEAEYYSIGN